MAPRPGAAGPNAPALQTPTRPRKKRSNKEEREYAELPRRIEALEAEQAALAERVAHPDFYKETAEEIRQALARIDAVEQELLTAMARWDELDSIARA